MLWMVGQSGIIDALNGRMRLQELRYLQGIRTMPLHAQCQRLQSTRNQKRLERTEHRSQHGGVAAQLLDLRIASAHDDSGGAITMPAEIFRCAVYNEVETERDGLDKIGRGEGAIDDAHRANLMSGGADCGEVRYACKRIR